MRFHKSARVTSSESYLPTNLVSYVIKDQSICCPEIVSVIHIWTTSPAKRK